MEKMGYHFPKLRFLNAKEVTVVKEYGLSGEDGDFYLHYPHELAYVERGKITIYCAFDFRDFPFDSHQCNLTMGIHIT